MMMSTDKPNDSEAAAPASEGSEDPADLFQPGPIHLQPTGEDVLFEGGNVGGLHIGPSGDRLPGADPLYDGSLEAKVKHPPEAASTKPA
jgi:hypothetical protein